MITDQLTRAGVVFTEVDDRLIVIHGNNRSRNPYSNSFLVLDTVNVLFDAGCGFDILEKLFSLVRIDRLFVSHSHIDHTSGCRLASTLTGCEILVPEQESGTITSTELLALRFVGPALAPLWMETYPPATGFEEFEYHGTYDHAYEVATGHMNFTALWTPGHLEDHYCFWEPQRRILLGFDIDLSPFGPWYGSPESDIESFESSIIHIRKLAAKIYLSSHARPVGSRHVERRLAKYQSHFDRRDEQILEILSQTTSMTLEEIVMRSPFYEADHSALLDGFVWFGEEQMVKKHLDRLVLGGRIHEEGGRYRISR
jgi:glyoxylase-like metal-dependent hydrolase (beta-lactamase superfamily II)